MNAGIFQLFLVKKSTASTLCLLNLARHDISEFARTFTKLNKCIKTIM